MSPKWKYYHKKTIQRYYCKQEIFFISAYYFIPWKFQYIAYSPVNVNTDSSLENVLINPAKLQVALDRHSESKLKYSPRYLESTQAIISR